MRYRILNWLHEWINEMLSDYCSICGKRLVRYPDGCMDCPDIVPAEKQRRGMKAV